MERDRNKNLILERDEVDDILSNVLKLNYSEQTQLEDKVLAGSNTVKYEDFMRNVVTTYFSSIGLQKNSAGQSVG